MQHSLQRKRRPAQRQPCFTKQNAHTSLPVRMPMHYTTCPAHAIDLTLQYSSTSLASRFFSCILISKRKKSAILDLKRFMWFENYFWERLFCVSFAKLRFMGHDLEAFFGEYGKSESRKLSTQWCIDDSLFGKYFWTFQNGRVVLSYSNSVSKKKCYATLHFISLHWIPRSFLEIWIRNKHGKGINWFKKVVMPNILDISKTI